MPNQKTALCAKRARFLSFAFEPTPEHRITLSRSTKPKDARQERLFTTEQSPERERGPLSNPCRAGRADFFRLSNETLRLKRASFDAPSIETPIPQMRKSLK